MSNDLTINGTPINKPASIFDLPPEMDGELREAYVDLVRSSTWDGRTYALARLPTETERKLLKERFHALTPVIKPISLSNSALQSAGAEIADMFGCWPAFKPEDKNQSIGYYVSTLQDLPLFAIKEACADISRGNIDKLSSYAPPPAPVVYQLAAEKAKRILDQHAALRRILSTRTVRIEHQLSDADKEKIRQGLQLRATEIREQDQRIDTERQKELTARKIDYDTATILEEYKHANLKPVYLGGRPVTVSLLKRIEEYKNEPVGRRDQYKDEGS